MDRILLLHASVGMGHLSAANAVAKAIQTTGAAHTVVEDSLCYAPNLVRKLYSGLYLSISEAAPEFWSFFYTQTDRPDPQNMRKLDSRLYSTAMGTAQLSMVLEHTQPAAIVCTHFLPIEMLDAQTYRRLPPIYCVLTDYHAHPFWKSDLVNRYFVPTQETRQQLVHTGIADSRISVTGIPIQPITVTNTQCQIRQELNVPQHRPVVLMILSGLPLPRARALIEACLAVRPLCTLLVAVGRNQTLARNLLDLEWRSGGTMRLIGAQASLNKYLTASDVVISKAGGLTVSEVMAHGKPLLIPLPVPGQEEFNARYAIQAGAALGCISVDDFEQTLRHLLSHPNQAERMSKAAHAIAQPHAADKIATRILSDLHTSTAQKQLTALA